jgi:hypothetical protein
MTMVSFRNLSSMATKAKEAVEKRGGTEALKQDAAELRSIAKRPGSLTDKAKAAAEALKRPGEEGAAKPEFTKRGEAPRAEAKAKPRAKAKKTPDAR